MAGGTPQLDLAQVDAVFFDFDGVLADSLAIKVSAFQALFEHEPPALQQQAVDYFYRYTGRARQEKIEYVYNRILKRAIDTREIESLAQRFSEHSLEAVIKCPEIPGTTALLEHLPARIKKFIVSGTPEQELTAIVRARNISHHFQEVKGTPRRKEDNVADLLAQYRLRPSACLMLGDGRVDQLAADKNHLNFIGVVASGAASPFSDNTPTASDLTEIGQWLGVW